MDEKNQRMSFGLTSGGKRSCLWTTDHATDSHRECRPGKERQGNNCDQS